MRKIPKMQFTSDQREECCQQCEAQKQVKQDSKTEGQQGGKAEGLKALGSKIARRQCCKAERQQGSKALR